MINIKNKKDCCGCTACANICPVNAIDMMKDEEGFLYPVVNISKCANCKKCEQVCPALSHRKSEYCKESDGIRYVVQNRSEEILLQSTSGGAFTAFAEKIISEDGAVFGAYMDDGFNVKHTHVLKMDELGIFRNSKYVQSEIGYAYRECLEYLKNGKKVLFSGTPCQIFGLKNYLGKEYDNLVLVDVICHAVPSPKVFKKYIELCKMRFPDIQKIVFRDKAFGYSYTTMSIYYKEDGKMKVCRKSRYLDEWYRLFFDGYCNREVCYSCPYQFGKRESDITIWDCYEANKLAPDLDNNKGVTNLIAWTEKGNEVIQDLQNKLVIKRIEFNPLEKCLYRGLDMIKKKDVPNIYKDVDTLSAKVFFNKYTPNTIHIYIQEYLRKMLLILGVHDFIQKIMHRIRSM